MLRQAFHKRGTKYIKPIKNDSNCTDPMNMTFFDLFKLLYFEIAFMTKQEGKIPIERTNNTVSAVTYCNPIIDNMNLGSTISAE